MTPTPEVTNLIGGILAAACAKFSPIRLHDGVFLSNHYHLVLSAKDPSAIPVFVAWLNRELSIRIGRVVDWPGAFFDRRYDSREISDLAGLIGVIRYLRAHGVKEGLVPSHREWPGLSLVHEATGGEPRSYSFERRTERRVEWNTLKVHPLEAFGDMTESEYHDFMRAIEIDAENDSQSIGGRRTKIALGAKRVVDQNPKTRVPRPERPRSSTCIAADPVLRAEYLHRYRDFVIRLRVAYDQLLSAWQSIGNESYCLPGFAFVST